MTTLSRRARRSLELDPLSLLLSAVLGYHFYARREYEAAIAQLEKTLEMDATFVPARLFLGYARLKTGAYAEAIAQFQEAMRLSGGSTLAKAWLGCAFARSGRRSEAEDILEELVEVSRKRYVSAYCLAMIHTALGDVDLAFSDLERAYSMHAHEMTFIGWEPNLDSLRSDPRFVNLLRRMGLPPQDRAGSSRWKFRADLELDRKNSERDLIDRRAC